MDPQWYNQELSTGTSIMAVEFEGGVVLGADSRTTTGVYIANRVTDKLCPISENIYCCQSGSAADTQAICDIVAYHLKFHQMELGEEPRVEVAAKIMQEICYEYRDSLMADIILCGWDKYKGGQVFAIPLGGMITRQSVSVGGSGSTYVYGNVDAGYKPNMTQEEGLKFVTETLSCAMARDGSSGGVIRLAVITKTGVERHVVLGEQLPRFFEG